MNRLNQRRRELAKKLANMTPQEFRQSVRNEAAYITTMKLSEGNVRLQAGRFKILQSA